jgi:hypothetical protein
MTLSDDANGPRIVTARGFGISVEPAAALLLTRTLSLPRNDKHLVAVISRRVRRLRAVSLSLTVEDNSFPWRGDESVRNNLPSAVGAITFPAAPLD